ncbi:MAG: hypothetical protein IH586_18755 [Anaerolineaceae bacterium]|nr:hypothetical protein [Anaerolineaceae bacterium]
MPEQKNTPTIYIALTKDKLDALVLPGKYDEVARHWKTGRSTVLSGFDPEFIIPNTGDLGADRKAALTSQQNKHTGGWRFWDHVHVQGQQPDLENPG